MEFFKIFYDFVPKWQSDKKQKKKNSELSNFEPKVVYENEV